MFLLLALMTGCGINRPSDPYDSCLVQYEILCDVCDGGGICDYDDDDRIEQIDLKCIAFANAHDAGAVGEGFEWDEVAYACYNDVYADTCDGYEAAEECFGVTRNTEG